MDWFSQRKGLKPVNDVIQINSMDRNLRVAIWNALTVSYWNRISGILELHRSDPIREFAEYLWISYFNRPVDTLGEYWHQVLEDIRKYFFNCEWYEVYDFVESVVYFFPDESMNRGFVNFCNIMLEKELSGYRIVGEKVVEVTSPEEMNEVEEAMESSASLIHVSDHMKRALDLLADRNQPDYRNSIKESISAVEAICKIITGDSRATLGQALRTIEKDESARVHPALNAAFNKLYGYTNDADGVRHALTKESDLSFEDAKFMLVSCSAFVNYLKAKASKAEIHLK